MAEPDPVDATDPRPAGLRIVVTSMAAALPVLGGVWVIDIPARLGFVVFTEQMLAIMLGLAIALVFLNVPADRGKRHRLPWYDAGAAAVGLATATPRNPSAAVPRAFRIGAECAGSQLTPGPPSTPRPVLLRLARVRSHLERHRRRARHRHGADIGGNGSSGRWRLIFLKLKTSMPVDSSNRADLCCKARGNHGHGRLPRTVPDKPFRVTRAFRTTGRAVSTCPRRAHPI